MALTRALLAELPALAHRANIAEDLRCYREPDGVAELLTAFVAHLGHCFDRRVSPDEVMVTPGAQAALRYIQWDARCQDRGVFLPAGVEFPGAWDDTDPGRTRVGALPAVVEGEWARPSLRAIATDWDGIAAAVLSRPHNPTGQVWPAADVLQLAAYAHDRNATLVLDEAYGFPLASMARTGLSDFVDAPNILHVYSFSKLGLAGERVGVVVGPPETVLRLKQFQRRFIIQTPKLGQYLAVGLLRVLEERPLLGSELSDLLRERAEFLDLAWHTAGLTGSKFCLTPWEGGPFRWVQWTGPPSDHEVVDSLLDRGVAVAGAIHFRPRLEGHMTAAWSGLRLALTRTLTELSRGVQLVVETLASQLNH
jgi:alanine-alpha-ketoisovalerate/valine-pyruvate aminotransferase